MRATEKSYRIGEVAQRTGVSVEALRYYERLDLLERPPRTSGGARRYGAAAIERVRFIRQAQTLGLTLREIGALLADGGQPSGARCRDVRDLLDHHLGEIDRRVRELRALRRTLVGHRARCDRALAAELEPSCPTLDALAGGEQRSAGEPEPIDAVEAARGRRAPALGLAVAPERSP